MAAAAVSAYWAIRLLLRLVQERILLARYVVVFATVLLVGTFVID